MNKQGLFSVALVLATFTIAAQMSTSGAAQQQAATPYVPAIMQARMTRLTGCLQQQKDMFVLANVTLSQAGAAQAAAAAPQAKPAAKPAPEISPSYRLEGLSGARLSLYVGERVQVVGAFQGPTTTAKDQLPRFEATDLMEVEGTCS